MPHPANGYMHPDDGAPVPSVTEVLKAVGWGMDALIRWAEKQGAKGESAEASRDRGADVGSCVHDQCECILTGEIFDRDRYSTDVLLQSARAVTSFHDWVAATDLRVHATELGLVHPDLRYGGTLDVWADLDGRPAIIDLKTTKAVYPKHILQIAAYAKLVEWHYPAEIERGVIIRLGGNGGIELVEVSGDQLEQAFWTFYAALELHRREGEITRWIQQGRW